MIGTDQLRVPGKQEFEDNEAEFLPAYAAEERAFQLIGAYPELAPLAEVTFKVLWKKEGGKSRGKLTMGQCTKTSGTTKHFAHVDYLITLSADHCRDYGLDDRQLEALLYHELKHILVTQDEDGDPVLKVRGHDLEAFEDEVARYGLWTLDLRRMSEVMTQAALPLGSGA